ncbi:hypothetical protein Mal52_59000 [Symmachiella dynata]|uniref:Uncharacterized protein n=1 Tax=Symmachiella dynata TaxID=2527995 RepID=A0A517ZY14_9PLAN|nr:hypothetical protein [Symmachiella dynata]QDU47371.1 hypothetical protein Mal52_59000 [Symmachiella dynata]
MVANISQIDACADIGKLVFLLGKVREAARSFEDLAGRFRLAPLRGSPPQILKHDVNNVFAVQAGELLCQCWRRGMFSIYRPHFYLPEESEPRLRYVFSWFTFIRWHLAPTFNNRFRADWQSEFATAVDQLRGQQNGPPAAFTAAVSDDARELAVWRLNLCADVQATACAILAEELQNLLEAIERRLKQFPPDKDGQPSDEQGPTAGASTTSGGRIEVDIPYSRVRLDDMWYEVSPNAALLLNECVKSHPKPVFASHLDGDIRPKRVKESLPRQLRSLFRSEQGRGCWLEIES